VVKGYRTVKSIYRGVLPESVRDQIYRLSPAPVKSLKKRIIAVLERDAVHDDIYDERYFEKIVEPTMQLSARAMAASIARDLSPARAIDVGCGTGVLLTELRVLGIHAMGFELADAAIARCHARGLDVRKLDIEHDPIPDVRADVVVSTEVAEHLPESCAEKFVDLLAGLADRVLLTAAMPGVDGTDHVNEQPNEYWIDKFERRGRLFDRHTSLAWRDEWEKAGVAHCFWSSAMLFRSR
jgi:SAM-dependent methyltransferase